MPSETSINHVINEIINARKEKIEVWKVRRKEFAKTRNYIESLWKKSQASAKDETLGKLYEYNPWLQDLLKKPQLFSDCIAAYDDALGELDHLIDRFDRESVNISVVGDSKAGKSRFLQTVSGLGNECIPSFVGSFCTGVSSIIENDNTLEGVKGVFTFKTESEILGEINHKLSRITGGSLYAASLMDVQRLSEQDIRNRLANELEEGTISAFVKMYIENFTKWAGLISLSENDYGTMEKYHLKPLAPDQRKYVCEEPSQIQKFVAKHDGGSVEAGGTDAIPLYCYIAVKSAIIYSRFKLTDVNRIRLIDTVGLGDTAVGTTEKMYEAIDKDSDAVLYFFRPEANKGGAIDDRTFHILNYELYPRYKNEHMKWWMGVVINHITGKTTYDKDNINECHSFLEGFKTSAPRMAQNVVFKEIIDVSDSAQVSQKCMQPLLESISGHLGEIDRRIEANTNEKIKTANDLLASLKKNFSDVRIPVLGDIINSRFKDIFCEFTKSIQDMCGQYTANGAGLCDTFLEESLDRTAKLQEPDGDVTIYSLCRSLDYIVEGTSKRTRAFGELQRIVRNIGSRDTEELNGIEKTFKRDLAELFLDKFGFDRAKCPEPESGTFFLDMAEQLFGTKEDLAMLKDAFLSVHTFKLNETKGLTKLVFDENADRYFNHATAPMASPKTDAPSAGRPQPLPVQGISISHLTPKNEAMANVQPQSSPAKDDALIDELKQKLDLFMDSVRESEIYAIKDMIPLSRQIVSQIRYFLRCFDIIYHREWEFVLNDQLRNGCIFTSEKQDVDSLSEKFDDFRQMINQLQFLT